MRSARTDAGFTLVELSVVILLMGVIGAITTSVIVASVHSESGLQGRAATVINVRQALQRTMRDIRAADPLWALTSNALNMSITAPSGATRTVSYCVTTSGGVTSLVEDTSAQQGALTCAASSRTVISHLVNSGSQPVFSAVALPGYTSSNSSVNASTCAVSGSNPTAYSRECVGTVDVRLVVLPTRQLTGASLCPATLANPSACYVDVGDSADLRNQT